MLTIDFETYYSKEFSLSKMTTEAYIRSPEFEVIGVCVKEDDGPIRWITGSTAVIKAELQKYHMEDNQVLAHNMAFDGAILSWIFDIHPAWLFDTLSMARPITGLTVGGSLKALAEQFELGHKGTEIYNTLGKRRKDFTDEELERFGEYCKQDVNLTYQLFWKLLPYSTKKEMYLIDLGLRMFTEPKVVLDKERLERHLANVRAKKAELLTKVQEDVSMLMSANKFAELLRAEGVEPPAKVSPTTGKESYAFAKTDEAFKELLNHPNERVQALVAARLGVRSTIEESRTESLIKVAERGTLPIMLNYYGALSGRYCLTGDTVITVCREGVVKDIQLKELLDSDLVWDGETFCSHGGLLDQGERVVITYQGVTGTPDHRVFVEEINDAVELQEARLRGYTIKTPAGPFDGRPEAKASDPH